MNVHGFTSSDRVTIAAVHKKGADRRIFGRLEYGAAEGVEYAEIYPPEAKTGDLPALIVTRATVDSLHVLARAFDMLATAEKLGPVARALAQKTASKTGEDVPPGVAKAMAAKSVSELLSSAPPLQVPPPQPPRAPSFTPFSIDKPKVGIALAAGNKPGARPTASAKKPALLATVSVSSVAAGAPRLADSKMDGPKMNGAKPNSTSATPPKKPEAKAAVAATPKKEARAKPASVAKSSAASDAKPAAKPVASAKEAVAPVIAAAKKVVAKAVATVKPAAAAKVSTKKAAPAKVSAPKKPAAKAAPKKAAAKPAKPAAKPAKKAAPAAARKGAPRNPERKAAKRRERPVPAPRKASGKVRPRRAARASSAPARARA